MDDIERNRWGLPVDKPVGPHDGVFWHGSPSGELVGAPYGLHVGTYGAAKDALEASIGRRADGKPWDGTQAYGETPVVSKGAGYGMGPPGDSRRIENPYEPHLPTGTATYSDGTPVPMHAKPNLFPVRITGPMTNTPNNPYEDFKANGYMRAQITRGNAKRGYYYSNQGEGVTVDPLTGNIKNSISAVVPNGGAHLERLDRAEHPFPTAMRKMAAEHDDIVSDFLQWCADNGPNMPPDQEALDQYADQVELTPEETQDIQYFLGYFENQELQREAMWHAGVTQGDLLASDIVDDYLTGSGTRPFHELDPKTMQRIPDDKLHYFHRPPVYTGPPENLQKIDDLAKSLRSKWEL